jgi:hypothetical protein
MKHEHPHLGCDPAKPGSEHTVCTLSWGGQTFEGRNVTITTLVDIQYQPRFLRDVPKFKTITGKMMIIYEPVILSRKQRIRRRRLAARRRNAATQMTLTFKKSLEDQLADRIAAKAVTIQLPVTLNRLHRFNALTFTAADLAREHGYQAEMRRHIKESTKPI